MKQRTFLVAGLLLCLLIAGVGSYYASSHPDGLERVAASTGFGDSAEDSAVADSPLADYQVTGVEDDRLSGGLAGILGVALMAVLSTALFWGIRRRRGDDDTGDSSSDSPADGRA